MPSPISPRLAREISRCDHGFENRNGRVILLAAL
jgi:hypothetical protein